MNKDGKTFPNENIRSLHFLAGKTKETLKSIDDENGGHHDIRKTYHDFIQILNNMLPESEVPSAQSK